MNDDHRLVGHLIDHCGCLARPWDTWVPVVCMHSWWVCPALHTCLVGLQWSCTPLWWVNMCRGRGRWRVERGGGRRQVRGYSATILFLLSSAETEILVADSVMVPRVTNYLLAEEAW